MPIVCPLREPIEGLPMTTKVAAKRVAALEVCKRLHQIGELNNNLLPITENEDLDNYDCLFTNCTAVDDKPAITSAVKQTEENGDEKLKEPRKSEFQEERDFEINEEVLILSEDEPCMGEHVNIPKTLGDLFESLAGAVFLDTGMDLQATWSVFYKLMWREIEMFRRNVPISPVRMLYENVKASPKFGTISNKKEDLLVK
ncbi:Dicer-1 [Carabus blaptoides fortunei]